MNHNNSNDHLLGSITIFLIFALIASTTLLIAISLWLAELMDSLIGAMVVIGFVSTLTAVIVYFTTLRPAVSRLRDKVAMIYEVTSVIHTVYQWVAKVVGSFFA